jgi:predicted ABC-type ATPase
VNGAGKSSIGGACLREHDGEYYDPDEAARAAMAACPGLNQRDANTFARQEGQQRLDAAISAASTFTFETTLGGDTITRRLIEAAARGAVVRIWFAGLESVELQLQRVAARVTKGGHDIPGNDVRRRWVGSHANLIRLTPYVTDLRVYDNSVECDPAAGELPEPRLLLAIEEKQLTYPPSAWSKLRSGPNQSCSPPTGISGSRCDEALPPARSWSALSAFACDTRRPHACP